VSALSIFIISSIQGSNFPIHAFPITQQLKPQFVKTFFNFVCAPSVGRIWNLLWKETTTFETERKGRLYPENWAYFHAPPSCTFSPYRLGSSAAPLLGWCYFALFCSGADHTLLKFRWGHSELCSSVSVNYKLPLTRTLLHTDNSRSK